MDLLKRLLGHNEQTIEEKKAEVSEQVHIDKNIFQEEMLKYEARAADISKRTQRLHREFKKSVAYKLAIATGGGNRGLK